MDFDKGLGCKFDEDSPPLSSILQHSPFPSHTTTSPYYPVSMPSVANRSQGMCQASKSRVNHGNFSTWQFFSWASDANSYFISSPESSWLSVAFVHFLSNFVFTPLIVSCGHLFSIFPQLNRSHNAMCFPLSLFSISYLLSELSFYRHVECTLMTGTRSHKYWHGLKLWSKQHNVWEMTHNSASLQSALNSLHLCVQLVLPLCLLFQFLALWRFYDFSFSPPIVWIVSFLFMGLLLHLASDFSAEEVVSSNSREVGGVQEDWVLCAIDTSTLQALERSQSWWWSLNVH